MLKLLGYIEQKVLKPIYKEEPVRKERPVNQQMVQSIAKSLSSVDSITSQEKLAQFLQFK